MSRHLQRCKFQNYLSGFCAGWVTLPRVQILFTFYPDLVNPVVAKIVDVGKLLANPKSKISQDQLLLSFSPMPLTRPLSGKRRAQVRQLRAIFELLVFGGCCYFNRLAVADGVNFAIFVVTRHDRIHR